MATYELTPWLKIKKGAIRVYRIQLYDIRNHPQLINVSMTDKANQFYNDLYILIDGNHFHFDTEAASALLTLAKYIIEKLEEKYE